MTDTYRVGERLRLDLVVKCNSGDIVELQLPSGQTTWLSTSWLNRCERLDAHAHASDAEKGQ